MRIFLVILVALATYSLTGVSNGSAAVLAKHSYSPWEYHAKYKYYWRAYKYKADSHHYAIYHPSRGKRIYYYNPKAKRYWGYYDVEEKAYSLLPEKWRLNSLNEIPAESFPKPSREMPRIPNEDIVFEPPTDELPQLEQKPDSSP